MIEIQLPCCEAIVRVETLGDVVRCDACDIELTVADDVLDPVLVAAGRSLLGSGPTAAPCRAAARAVAPARYPSRARSTEAAGQPRPRRPVVQPEPEGVT